MEEYAKYWVYLYYNEKSPPVVLYGDKDYEIVQRFVDCLGFEDYGLRLKTDKFKKSNTKRRKQELMKIMKAGEPDLYVKFNDPLNKNPDKKEPLKKVWPHYYSDKMLIYIEFNVLPIANVILKYKEVLEKDMTFEEFKEKFCTNP